MYTGAGLSRSGLVLYYIMLSEAGGKNGGNSAKSERSLLGRLIVTSLAYCDVTKNYHA